MADHEQDERTVVDDVRELQTLDELYDVINEALERAADMDRSLPMYRGFLEAVRDNLNQEFAALHEDEAAPAEKPR